MAADLQLLQTSIDEQNLKLHSISTMKEAVVSQLKVIFDMLQSLNDKVTSIKIFYNLTSIRPS